MKHLEDRVLIIIPAYNVGDTVSKVLEKLSRYKVLVVDDGSSDNTYEIISRYGISIIHHNENRGVSDAIKTGIQYALSNGYNAVITMDADGQHDPSYIDAFLEKLNSCDLVCGNRFNDFTGVPTSKLSSNTFASCVLQSLYDLYIPDACCGYKAFRINNDLLKCIEKSSDYSIVFDILLYAIQNKYKISYVDIKAIYYSNILWVTRSLEIKSFFQAINRANMKSDLLTYIENRCNQRHNYDVKICGVQFSLFYLSNYDSYLIQANYNSIYNFHNDMRQNEKAIKHNYSRL